MSAWLIATATGRLADVDALRGRAARDRAGAASQPVVARRHRRARATRRRAPSAARDHPAPRRRGTRSSIAGHGFGLPPGRSRSSSARPPAPSSSATAAPRPVAPGSVPRACARTTMRPSRVASSTVEHDLAARAVARAHRPGDRSHRRARRGTRARRRHHGARRDRRSRATCACVSASSARHSTASAPCATCGSITRRLEQLGRVGAATQPIERRGRDHDCIDSMLGIALARDGSRCCRAIL